MPWGSSNGAQVRKPKKARSFGPRLPRDPSGEFGMNSPNLLGQTGRFSWMRIEQTPPEINRYTSSIHPPEGCKMDLLKCVKTVVDFFWDPWNQQIWVMWCDRGHFKCSSFAVGYPQIVLERLQDLLEKYLQSISLEFGISMDWYKSWSSYNHSPQFYHGIPHVQRWRKIFGISFVRNQVATVHGIFSWLVSIVSIHPPKGKPIIHQLYTNHIGRGVPYHIGF